MKPLTSTTCYSTPNPHLPRGIRLVCAGLPHHKILSLLISHSCAYEDGTGTVPKRRLLNTIRRRTTQKITHNIQNTAKA
jgi:hypothetical protein